MGADCAGTRAVGCDRLIGWAGDSRFVHIVISNLNGHGARTAIHIVADRAVQGVSTFSQRAGKGKLIAALVIGACGQGQVLVCVPGAACCETVGAADLQCISDGASSRDRLYDEVVVRYVRDGVALWVFNDTIVGECGVGVRSCGIYDEKPAVGEGAAVVEGGSQGECGAGGVIKYGLILISKPITRDTRPGSNGNFPSIGE